ncbi:putative disease resistance protein RGA3 [Ziziphus jujuba]|uniref:Disease resistance protein RGA3 n=1 Tax=Ziziphus jujuba TaxID=326968 RepID=A0ABM3IKX1_ZIZJJ|nr:putative disease resistance protein RGA3 [Ziziphus jujuba]
MARLYPSGVVNSIIERLHSEAVRQIGVTDELSGLEKTFSSVKAVLTDAEKKQRADKAVKRWLERLEDAVYEAEELVDELSYEALRQQRAGMLGRDSITKKVCTFFSTSLNQVALHGKLGNKVKAINKRLAAIRDDRDFALEKRHEEDIVVTGGEEPTPSYVPEDEVIALESDKMAIKQYLLDATKSNKENVQVIAIVGMGGAGKSTLAKLAYNDEEVVKHFDLRLWVNLSDNFDERFVIRNIVKYATKKDFENLETYQLKQKLGKIVRGKRYLLVLVDVQYVSDKWTSLKLLLSGCAYGSKIIITTRSCDFAHTMGTMPPYELSLSKEKSWDLFQEMAFMNREEPINSEIEETRRRIVDICSGNLFLIRTIGRIFYSKNPKTEWSSLLEMLECRSREAPHGYVFRMLEIAYENLPSH